MAIWHYYLKHNGYSNTSIILFLSLYSLYALVDFKISNDNIILNNISLKNTYHLLYYDGSSDELFF